MGFIKYLAILAVAAFVISLGVAWVANSGHSKQYSFRPSVIMTIYVDRGGEFIQYYENIKEERRRGVFYAIKGICASACTMRLSRSCVYPTAKLLFHTPYAIPTELPDDVTAEEANERVDYLRQIMMRTLPGPVQAWASENGALNDLHLTQLPFDQMIKMGIPDCRDLIRG